MIALFLIFASPEIIIDETTPVEEASMDVADDEMLVISVGCDEA